MIRFWWREYETRLERKEKKSDIQSKEFVCNWKTIRRMHEIICLCHLHIAWECKFIKVSRKIIGIILCIDTYNQFFSFFWKHYRLSVLIFGKIRSRTIQTSSLRKYVAIKYSESFFLKGIKIFFHFSKNLR